MITVHTLQNESARRENCHAHLLCAKLQLRHADERRGRGCAAGGRFARYGGAGAQFNLAGEPARNVLPHRSGARQQRVLIVADLPFGAYQQSKEQAFAASAELMAAGAHMVKLEGGVWMAETTEFLQMRGIPVCAHIGLTPQSVNAFGGYRVQGKGDAAAQALLNDAKAHDEAGAALILMECVPAALAKQVTESVNSPTIGIGAGVDCDGQVLVMHDMLGIFPGKTARFVKNFMDGQTSIQGAVKAYVDAVKGKTFPAVEHTF